MNISSFDLNLLLVLEAALEERNITQAARRVGLSQPATSSALRRLREALDDPLLVRSGRLMQLTDRAEVLLPQVSTALNHLRSALGEKAAFDPAVSARPFTVAANDYAEIVLLPVVLRRLQAIGPGIVLRFLRTENLFDPPVEHLISGTADLAISFGGNSPSVQTSLGVEELWMEQNVAIARRRHPRIRGQIDQTQFLLEHHAAVFYHRSRTGLIDSLLQKEGLKRRVIITLPHFVGVCYMVSTTDLIAVVPRRLAETFQAPFKLQILECPIKMPDFRLDMLFHQRTRSDPAQIWLRSIFAQAGS